MFCARWVLEMPSEMHNKQRITSLLSFLETYEKDVVSLLVHTVVETWVRNFNWETAVLIRSKIRWIVYRWCLQEKWWWEFSVTKKITVLLVEFTEGSITDFLWNWRTVRLEQYKYSTVSAVSWTPGYDRPRQRSIAYCSSNARMFMIVWVEDLKSFPIQSWCGTEQ